MTYMLADDAPFAVPLERYEAPALRVLANFGIVTGRVPTQQEVQQLAREVEHHVPTATIFVEQRYELGAGIDICLHEVRIEVPDRVVDGLRDSIEPEELQERIVLAAAAWVGRCVGSHGDATSIAELRARKAVVDGRDGR
jgi:hypothetical protein